MALPVAKIRCLEQIYSPFSGLPAGSEEEPDGTDPTLLFVFNGMAGEYEYVSKRLQGLVDGDVEDVDVEDLVADLSVDGGLVLEVDADWNGVNTYGFAPAGE